MRAYDRVSFRGFTFDKMTVAAIQHAEDLLGGTVRIMQDSYNGGSVSASAGTHDGGGAVDIDNGNHSWDDVVRAFRLAGWAFWHRPALPGVWPDHGHGILIGNARVAPSARSQVQDYYRHLNGLASHAHDGAWHPSPIVPFNYPLGIVDTPVVYREAKKRDGFTPRISVRHVQRALNLKSGAALSVDGIYGPVTQRAYARYEKQHNGDGNGIPTTRMLRRLGAARFRVRD